MAVTQTWKVQAAPGYLLEDIYLKSADAHAFLVSFKPTSLPSPLKLHRKQRKDLQDRLLPTALTSHTKKGKRALQKLVKSRLVSTNVSLMVRSLGQAVFFSCLPGEAWLADSLQHTVNTPKWN